MTVTVAVLMPHHRGGPYIGFGRPANTRSGQSVAQPVSKWLLDTVIADEVEKHIGQFAYQAPIQIRETAFRLLPGAMRNSDIAGAIHGRVVYLFMAKRATCAGTPWTFSHELFH